jgi:hypothetical protein
MFSKNRETDKSGDACAGTMIWVKNKSKKKALTDILNVMETILKDEKKTDFAHLVLTYFVF